MHRSSLALVLGLGLVTAIGAPSWAADRCFTFPGFAGGINFVAKGFAVPGRNKCKPVSGFSEIEGWLLSGTACTKADGSALHLAMAGHPLILSGPSPFQVGCTIPLPALTGGNCHGTYTSGSSVSDEVIVVASTIDIVPCSVPVP